MSLQVVDIAGEKSNGLCPARYCLDQDLIGTAESCNEVLSCRGVGGVSSFFLWCARQGEGTAAGSASEFMSWCVVPFGFFATLPMMAESKPVEGPLKGPQKNWERAVNVRRITPRTFVLA